MLKNYIKPFLIHLYFNNILNISKKQWNIISSYIIVNNIFKNNDSNYYHLLSTIFWRYYRYIELSITYQYYRYSKNSKIPTIVTNLLVLKSFYYLNFWSTNQLNNYIFIYIFNSLVLILLITVLIATILIWTMLRGFVLRNWSNFEAFQETIAKNLYSHHVCLEKAAQTIRW